MVGASVRVYDAYGIVIDKKSGRSKCAVTTNTRKCLGVNRNLLRGFSGDVSAIGARLASRSRLCSGSGIAIGCRSVSGQSQARLLSIAQRWFLLRPSRLFFARGSFT
jgi:hypothetical protein